MTVVSSFHFVPTHAVSVTVSFLMLRWNFQKFVFCFSTPSRDSFVRSLVIELYRRNIFYNYLQIYTHSIFLIKNNVRVFVGGRQKNER